MKSMRILNVSLMMALAVALGASPADAQGKGKNKDKGKKQRTEQVREDRRDRDDRDERYDRRDGRWEDDVRLERRGDKRVPPGWCKGKGNPHNTPENCGHDASRRGDRRHDDRYDRDRRYDRRGDSGSFDQEHAEFHRWLDEEYRARAAQRPVTDLGWQIEVRRQKSEEHRRWHERVGIDHDGRRRY